MALPEFLVPVWQWIETHALTSPELAGFGLVAAFGLLAFLCAILGKSLVGLVSRLVSVVSASAVSRDRAPGYRVLLATFDGSNGGKARRFLEAAMQTHLATFSFDAPFRLVKTGLISGGRDEAAVKAARRRLKRSGADMIVWGRRISARPDGLRIYTLSRGGGMSVGEAQVEIATLPGRKAMWNETLAPVAAYLIARRLQPSLGRPSDFRPERMEPVVEALETLLEAGAGTAPAVREELERDFIAAALHVGEAGGKLEWLERVIEIRTRTLDELGTAPSPGVWTQAKLDLGRAMLAKAERHFDPDLVQTGAAHLREAVEMLKSDDALRAAEEALATLDKAQNLMENRKRFSINFNG